MPRRTTIPPKKDTRKNKKVPIDEILTDVTISLGRIKCMKDFTTEECSDDLFQVKERLVGVRDLDSKRLLAALLQEKDFVGAFKRLHASAAGVDLFHADNSVALSNFKEGVGILWLGCKLNPRLCSDAAATVLKPLLEFVAAKSPKTAGKTPSEDQVDITLGIFGIVHTLLSQSENEEILDVILEMPKEVEALAEYMTEGAAPKLSHAATLILTLIPCEVLGVKLDHRHIKILWLQLRQALQDSKFHYCKETGFGSADILRGIVDLLSRRPFVQCIDVAFADIDEDEANPWTEALLQILSETTTEREEELKFCCRLIWILFLSDDCRPKIREYKLGEIVTRLQSLANHSNSDVQQSVEAVGFLVDFLDRVSVNRSGGDSGSGSGVKRRSSHVFFCCSESEPRPVVRKLQDGLKMFNYEVWCSSPGAFTGSAFRDAADAVEGAAAVVLCICHRLEADVVARTCVFICGRLEVPLVALEIKATMKGGWIAELITRGSSHQPGSSLKVIDCHADSPLDDVVSKLADALTSLGKKGERQMLKATKSLSVSANSTRARRRTYLETEKRSRSLEKLLESSARESPSRERSPDRLDVRPNAHMTVSGSGPFTYPAPQLPQHAFLQRPGGGDALEARRKTSMTLAEVARALEAPMSPTSPESAVEIGDYRSFPVENWSQSEVLLWLRSVKLEASPLINQALTGELLLELKAMMIKVPEQYYLTVKEMGVAGCDVLRLTSGLRKLRP